ncbi:PEP-CTERM sorting domain-containing protein [Duganella sp. PWIR1]
MKTTKFRLSVLAAALALGTCASANANTVSLNATGLSSSYLADGVYSGQFNGSSVLPAQFQINSASFSFSFSDDVDGLVQQSYLNVGGDSSAYNFVSSSYNSSIGGTAYVYERTVHQYYTQQMVEAGESVQVTLGANNAAGGQGSTSASTSYVSTEINKGQSLDSHYVTSGYYYSCGNRCTGYQPAYEQTYYANNFDNITTTVVHSNGSFVVSGMITDADLLQQLTGSGALGFSLNVGGDLLLNSAQLELDVTPVSSVPEPDSLLMMLGGLGMLGYVARRRKSA